MSNLGKAVEAIRKRDPREPDLAMILGSGLGSLADSAANATVIPSAEIPGFHSAGVSGHRADLVLGEMSGRTVAFLRGRYHKYEGYGVDTLTFPVRVAAALGAPRLIVTNAAGSLKKGMPAGSIMRITDHINTTATDPLLALRETDGTGVLGPGRPGAGCYDTDWGRQVDDLALKLGIKLNHGVYVWTLGPSYETPSEISYFRRIGGDAVGMSTVPEVSAAHRLGLKVLGFSAITNLAAGLEAGVLSHGDVLEVGKAIHAKMERLIVAIAAATSDN